MATINQVVSGPYDSEAEGETNELEEGVPRSENRRGSRICKGVRF